jgi:hypothetical protein
LHHFHEDLDSACHLNADPDPPFHSGADPTFQFDPDPTTHFLPDLDPPVLHNDPLRFSPIYFDADPDPNSHFFDADPDPDSHFYTDPDPASQNNADPDPQHCIQVFLAM